MVPVELLATVLLEQIVRVTHASVVLIRFPLRLLVELLRVIANRVVCWFATDPTEIVFQRFVGRATCQGLIPNRIGGIKRLFEDVRHLRSVARCKLSVASLTHGIRQQPQPFPFPHHLRVAFS